MPLLSDGTKRKNLEQVFPYSYVQHSIFVNWKDLLPLYQNNKQIVQVSFFHLFDRVQARSIKFVVQVLTKKFFSNLLTVHES